MYKKKKVEKEGEGSGGRGRENECSMRASLTLLSMTNLLRRVARTHNKVVRSSAKLNLHLNHPDTTEF